MRNQNMNKIILSLLIFVLLIRVGVASEFAVSYAPITTGFTVTIVANVSGVSEKAMNFTGKINSTVYPTGTKNGTYRWGYIYNTGSTSLSFQMASPTPANIVLKVDAKNDMKHAFSVISKPGHPSGDNWNGWKNVRSLGSANIFAVATFNSKATKKFNVPVNVTAQ